MLTDIKRRNNDFVAALRREIESSKGGTLKLAEAAARAIRNGAPRYYFNYETACEMCQRMAKGAAPSGRRATQWHEFYSKVSHLAASEKITIAASTARILATEPASGFFISIKTALSIYNEYRRNRQSSKN